MKKSFIIGTLLAVTALTGCATTSKQQPVAKMQVAPVQLNFIQKRPNPIFYDESTLQKKFTACIQDELTKLGKFSTDSTSPILTVNLDYERNYRSKPSNPDYALGNAFFGFAYKISQNKQVLQKNTIATQHIYNADPANFFFNSTTPESEDKFIVGICKNIVETIK